MVDTPRNSISVVDVSYNPSSFGNDTQTRNGVGKLSLVDSSVSGVSDDHSVDVRINTGYGKNISSPNGALDLDVGSVGKDAKDRIPFKDKTPAHYSVEDMREDKRLQMPEQARDTRSLKERVLKGLAVTGSILAGAFAGAVAGSAFFGIGAIPGAIAGAAAGAALGGAVGGAEFKLLDMAFGGRPQAKHIEKAVNTLNDLGFNYSAPQLDALHDTSDGNFRALLHVSKRGGIDAEHRQSIRTALTHIVASSQDWDKAEQVKSTLMDAARSGDETKFRDTLVALDPRLARTMPSDKRLDWDRALDALKTGQDNGDLKLAEHYSRTNFMGESLDMLKAQNELAKMELKKGEAQGQAAFKDKLREIRDTFIDPNSDDTANLSYGLRQKLMADLTDDNIDRMTLNDLQRYKDLHAPENHHTNWAQSFSSISHMVQHSIGPVISSAVDSGAVDAQPKVSIPADHPANAGGPWYNDVFKAVGLDPKMLTLPMTSVRQVGGTVEDRIAQDVKDALEKAVDKNGLDLDDEQAVKKIIAKGIGDALYTVKSEMERRAQSPEHYQIPPDKVDEYKQAAQNAGVAEKNADALRDG